MAGRSSIRHLIKLLCCIAIFPCFIGCATAQTKYYFAAADLDDATGTPELTFYRVTLTGDSWGVTSSLQQGFYNADALHQLFGEVAKPAPVTDDKSTGAPTPKIPGASGTFQLVFDPTTGTWTSRNDSLFTVFYGANADKMAAQVQAVADDSSIAGALQALIGGSIPPAKKDTSAQTLAALKKKAVAAQTSATGLATALDGVAKNVKGTETPQELRQYLLTAANDVLKSLNQSQVNATGTPPDLDKAFAKIQTAYDKLNK